MSTNPIDSCVDQWHAFLKGDLPDGLDGLLHEDCAFLSPIVFTPQVGRELTKMYLTAAAGSLTGDDPQTSDENASSKDSATGFRYVKEIRGETQAMLEFETTVQGKYVNGVDIITCDDAGQITEFKVMIRPLQAVNLVHAQMKSMLESMQAG